MIRLVPVSSSLASFVLASRRTLFEARLTARSGALFGLVVGGSSRLNGAAMDAAGHHDCLWTSAFSGRLAALGGG
jgi:hypothetical protein